MAQVPTDQQLIALVEPIVSQHGFDLELLLVRAIGKRHQVKVAVDCDGGVDLDRVADLSRDISAVLDDHDELFATAYVLEVSSRGVDAPLTLPRHWRRARQRLVRVQLINDQVVTGRIIGSNETGVTLEVDGAETELEFNGIAKAVVQVEFNAKGQE